MVSTIVASGFVRELKAFIVVTKSRFGKKTLFLVALSLKPVIAGGCEE